jgi:hypothetical protein
MKFKIKNVAIYFLKRDVKEYKTGWSLTEKQEKISLFQIVISSKEDDSWLPVEQAHPYEFYLIDKRKLDKVKKTVKRPKSKKVEEADLFGFDFIDRRKSNSRYRRNLDRVKKIIKRFKR